MLRPLLLSLLFCSALAQAADTGSLKNKLRTDYPQLGRIDQVNKTPIRGLFEVVTGDHVFYVDEKGSYLIDGSLYDLKSMRNITEERSRKLFAIDFSSLPLDLALKQVKGSGKRKLVVFTDPNCGFCKKLESELKQVDNVTVYRMLYPIFPGSAEKVRNVWCSKDRVQAWEDLMLQGTLPTESNCDTPTSKVMELGQRFNVTGTPTLVFEDGSIVPGYLPAAELDRALNKAAGR